MPLPGPNGPGASTAGGSSLVVFRSSRHPDAAWRLVEYLSDPAVQLRFHELTGNLPPRRSAWRDERLAGDPHAGAFRDQLERARPAPKIPEWERIVTEMQLVAEQVVRGRMDVEEAGRELLNVVERVADRVEQAVAGGGARSPSGETRPRQPPKSESSATDAGDDEAARRSVRVEPSDD